MASAGADSKNGEFQVNSYTDNWQRKPSVAVLSDGGFVITWASFGQDGFEDGIYGQCYDSSGKKSGEEFQINTNVLGNQSNPSVAALADGGFVVIWPSRGWEGADIEVYGQRYNGSGEKFGEEFLVASYSDESQSSPSVAALNDGGFVVTWLAGSAELIVDEEISESAVYGQRYDSNGDIWGPEFIIVSSVTGYQDSVAITSLLDGGFVVTWNSYGQDGSAGGIYGQRYDSSGVKSGGEFQINSYTDGDQDLPSVTALQDGGFVVTWISVGQEGPDGSGAGIYGQRYDNNGAKVGEEFQINSYTAGWQSSPAITALADGGFVVVWESESQDGSGYGVYGQRYDSDGVRLGEEFLVNSYTQGMQDLPSVTALTDGGFVIVWESEGQDGSGWGIYGQRYNADGTPYVDGDDAPAILLGTDGNDTLYGTEVDDLIKGFAGNDALFGGKGSDLLMGGSGDDALFGGCDNDTLIGSDGADSLYGNGGDDTLAGGAGADLLMGNTGTDLLSGDAGMDRLYGGDGSDILDGGIGDDSLYGGNGADLLNGGIGNDALFGGNDNDMLSGSAGADSLYGNGGDDTLAGGIGDDLLMGNIGADLLIGDAGTDHLYGGDGTDLLDGGAGDDSLHGGAGADLLNGGIGNDALFGGNDNDTLIGSAGADSLYGNAGADILAGGTGADSLYGNAGSDIFVLGDDFHTAILIDAEPPFESGEGIGVENIDTIADFASGEDRIQLSGEIFADFDKGELNADLFAANATGSAVDADDRILYNTSSGALFYDADGSGAQEAVQFATLSNKTELQATDFLVA